jgi:hypothetical protein
MAYNRKGTSTEIFNGTETDVLVTPVTLKSNVWFFDGNSVSQERDLGTTNNFDIPIIRNNIEKLRIENATWTTGSVVTSMKIGANGSQAAIRFPLNSSVQHGLINESGGLLYFGIANGEASGSTMLYKPLSISTTGNVGINTVSPTAKLNLQNGTFKHDKDSVTLEQDVYVNTDVDTGVTEVIATIPTSGGTAAFFDYVIQNSTKTNLRAGTIQVVWNNSTVEYQEFSTLDIGDTSDVSFQPTINGTNMELRAVAATTSNWTVKCVGRTLS